MPKNRDVREIKEDEGVIIVKNGIGETRVYEIIGRTKKGLYVGRDGNGIKECFSEYDLGKIERVKLSEEEESSGKYR